MFDAGGGGGWQFWQREVGRVWPKVVQVTPAKTEMKDYNQDFLALFCSLLIQFSHPGRGRELSYFSFLFQYW